MHRSLIILFLLLAIVGLSGCGRKNRPDPAAAGLPDIARSPLSELWSELSDLYMSGQTNEMLTRLESALDDDAYADFRGDLVRELLGLQVRMERLDDAQALFLKSLSDSAVATDAMFGMIESQFLHRGDYDALAAWLDKLDALTNLSDALRTRVVGFRLEALRGQGDTDAFMALLERCVDQYPVNLAESIISGSLFSMLNEKQYELLERAVDMLIARFSDRAAVQRLVGRLRIQASLQQDQLDEAYALVLGALDVLTPQDHARFVDLLAQKGIAAGRTDFAKRVCDETMAQNASDSAPFRSAARQSIELARLAGDAALVQQRFALLITQGLPVTDLARILNHVFYFVVEKGDRAILTALLSDAETLSGRVESEPDQARLATLLLDASFLIEDYDRAIRILEKGIPGKDEAWHATLLPKVKAHRAMAAGDNEEAVRQFRTFMSLVVELDDGFPDPLTGAIVSRESILGLNAMRIAGLWEAAGKPDEAAAARKEAIDYYQKALEIEEPDSPIAKEIQQKLEELQG